MDRPTDRPTDQPGPVRRKRPVFLRGDRRPGNVATCAPSAVRLCAVDRRPTSVDASLDWPAMLVGPTNGPSCEQHGSKHGYKLMLLFVFRLHFSVRILYTLNSL